MGQQKQDRPDSPRPDSEMIIDALWARVRPDGTTAPVAAPDLLGRARALGDRAMRCVTSAIGGERDPLRDASADMLDALLSLWAACGVAPDEIWVELHKREQLGQLLMQINELQAKRGGRLPGRLRKPWRVESTKLP